MGGGSDQHAHLLPPFSHCSLASVPGIVAIKDATGGLDTASDVSIAAPGLTQLSGDDGLTVPFMSIGEGAATCAEARAAPAPPPHHAPLSTQAARASSPSCRTSCLSGSWLWSTRLCAVGVSSPWRRLACSHAPPAPATGDYVSAAASHRALLPLTKALFVETNPVPAKAALALLGLCHAAVRCVRPPARAAVVLGQPVPHPVSSPPPPRSLPLVGLTRESDAKLRAALEAAGLGPLHHHAAAADAQ